jgi:hypothetical protein
VACAGSAPQAARTSLPTLSDGDTDAALGYEKPPLQRAADVVPPDLLEGPHHHVADPVRSDGFMRIYVVESDFGTFEAVGDEMLRTRVAEVRALAELRELSASKEFAAALGRTLQSPFVAAWNLVTSPVRSISGIPRGAADALRRASELSRGERGELEDDALGEFFGFGKRKREIANRLSVDPYSSNAVLQKELNRFAWVSYIGGFGAMLVPFSGSPDDRAAPTPFDVAREDEILLDYAPEDLRRLNRIELSVMGIPEPLRQALVAQPWFSPRQQSLLVAHLAALDLVENRAALVEAATRASSEVDALRYVRMAELLRVYHEEVAPLERLAAFHGTVIGVTADRRVVAPLALDYAVWTRPAHEFANTLKRSSLSDGSAITRREILVSGAFSPRARAKIEARGIEVTEHALRHGAATHAHRAAR